MLIGESWAWLEIDRDGMAERGSLQFRIQPSRGSLIDVSSIQILLFFFNHSLILTSQLYWHGDDDDDEGHAPPNEEWMRVGIARITEYQWCENIQVCFKIKEAVGGAGELEE